MIKLFGLLAHTLLTWHTSLSIPVHFYGNKLDLSYIFMQFPGQEARRDWDHPERRKSKAKLIEYQLALLTHPLILPSKLPFVILSARDHCEPKISKDILPSESIFG
jgi:hypothetical protein